MVDFANIWIDGAVHWEYVITHIVMPLAQYLAMLVTTVLIPVLIKKVTEKVIEKTGIEHLKINDDMIKQMEELNNQILILRGKVPKEDIDEKMDV